MANMYHMQMSIGSARAFIKQYKSSCIYQGTHELTKKEAFNYLDRLEKDGFKVMPECTNIDATGKCLGHEEEFNPVKQD